MQTSTRHYCINHDLRGRFIKIPNLLGRLESLPKKVDTSLKTEEFSKRISFQCSVSVAGIPSPRNMDINSTAMVCQKRQKRHQHQLPHLPPRCCSAVVFWRSPGGVSSTLRQGGPNLKWKRARNDGRHLRHTLENALQSRFQQKT